MYLLLVKHVLNINIDNIDDIVNLRPASVLNAPFQASRRAYWSRARVAQQRVKCLKLTVVQGVAVQCLYP